MADGIWTMTEEGQFELLEPYATYLKEAKVESTRGWVESLVNYLEPKCPYSGQELADELLRRNDSRDGGAVSTFEEFVLEALSGDL